MILLLKLLIGLAFAATTNCTVAVMTFIGLFLQVFVALVNSGKDFFGFLLLIIYVGAIAVLFLFVIMTTEIDNSSKVLPIKAYINGGKVSSDILSYFTSRFKLLNWENFLSSYNFSKNEIFFIFFVGTGIVFFWVFNTILFTNYILLFWVKFTYIFSVSISLVFADLSWQHPFYSAIANDHYFSCLFTDLFSFNQARLSYWCGTLFTEAWHILYFCGFFLLIVTIGVIELVLPKKQGTKSDNNFGTSDHS